MSDVPHFCRWFDQLQHTAAAVPGVSSHMPPSLASNKGTDTLTRPLRLFLACCFHHHRSLFLLRQRVISRTKPRARKSLLRGRCQINSLISISVAAEPTLSGQRKRRREAKGRGQAQGREQARQRRSKRWRQGQSARERCQGRWQEAVGEG